MLFCMLLKQDVFSSVHLICLGNSEKAVLLVGWLSVKREITKTDFKHVCCNLRVKLRNNNMPNLPAHLKRVLHAA